MRSRLPAFLVAAQFAAIAVVALGGPVPRAWSLGVLGLALALVGRAWWVMPPRTFTVSPVPRAGGGLAVGGPYRFVRHPMYLAVILAATAFTVGGFTWWRALASLALLPVLVAKVRLEERLLDERFPDRAQRMAGVARLIPGVW
jgi:protein-S-isoprenylcysteine O-methyltransferase Ste14